MQKSPTKETIFSEIDLCNPKVAYTLNFLTIQTHCNILQHTATHCNTLQHTAKLCNTQTQKTTDHFDMSHMSEPRATECTSTNIQNRPR